MASLAALPNVYVKLSMLCYTNKDWDKSKAVVGAVHRVIKLFGIDRCFFASNFPVDVKDGWPGERLIPAFVDMALEYGLSDAKKLFSENAKKCYELTSAEAMEVAVRKP